ncbi:hypothetical protein ACIBCD_08415 [Nocardia brasiliensis]|uniref:hypothetical protein n=1 Tax=Nocardia brasiliensis TaxID=37326 RepID=UPI002458A25A|nr:hypothetical protein [Nocardia brasiliensis]
MEVSSIAVACGRCQVDIPIHPRTCRKTVGTKIGQIDIEKGATSSVANRRHYVEPAHERPDAREFSDDFADLS